MKNGTKRGIYIQRKILVEGKEEVSNIFFKEKDCQIERKNANIYIVKIPHQTLTRASHD